MTIHGRIIPGVRFRTLTSRGWTKHPAESARKGRKRLARFVLYLGAGS